MHQSIDVGVEDNAVRGTSRISLKDQSTSCGEHFFPSWARIVKTPSFEAAIGAAIILNCMTMGIQADTLLGHAEGWQSFVDISEHLFTALFAAELVLRFAVLGWPSFSPLHGGTSNFVDAMIVLISGVLVVWVLPLMGIPQSNALRAFTVLRACRLVRLVRVVERVPAFQEIWQLMRGFIESMHTLFGTLAFIFVVTYIFAVFGVALISTEVKALLEAEPLEENREELTALLSLLDGIFAMMHTLLQVLTLDSWNSIARPLMKYIWWSVFFFYAYISVGVIVLLNLVTASIVDNAMKNSKKDEDQLLVEKQEQQKHLMDEFRSLFQMVDGDGNGALTWHEFQDAFKVPEVATKLKMLDFEPASCHELFLLLDTGDGALTLGEFFEGIQAMQGPAKSKDSFKLLKLVESMNQTLQELTDGATGAKYLDKTPHLDKLGSGSVSSPQKAQSPLLHSSGTALHSKLSRQLMALPPAISSPRCPLDSYSTELQNSPAFSVARRKHLHSCSDDMTESTVDSTVDSTSRIEDVADQVSACNRKVDSLAAAVADIQAHLALVMKHLDCN